MPLRCCAGRVAVIDPTDCEFCDGYGRAWNNADPTSGQFHECEECQPVSSQGAERANNPLRVDP